MHSSLLSRSIVVAASLAVGSVALAATPASAVPAVNSSTHDQILAAAAGVRLADPTNAQDYATYKALRVIAARACNVDLEAGDDIYPGRAYAFQAGDDADGVVVSSYIYSYDGTKSSNRDCTIAAVATTDASFKLTGSVTISGELESTSPSDLSIQAASQLLTSPLSGDSFVTQPIDTNNYDSLSATAMGNATKTTVTPVVKKIKDKKSKAEKKTAKKKFSKRLAQAEKNYKKALDKAGSSKNKKAAAKRVYAKARALAKARYAYAIAPYRNKNSTTTTVENRPFSITTGDPKYYGG